MKTNTLTTADITDTIWLLAQAVANGEITVTKQTQNPDGTHTIEWTRTK